MTGILGQLKWESLKKRRNDNRLILLYKGLKGKARIPTDDLIPKTRRGRNGCWSTRTFTNSYFGQLVPKNSYFTFPWSTRTLVNSYLKTRTLLFPGQLVLYAFGQLVLCNWSRLKLTKGKDNCIQLLRQQHYLSNQRFIIQ